MSAYARSCVWREKFELKKHVPYKEHSGNICFGTGYSRAGRVILVAIVYEVFTERSVIRSINLHERSITAHVYA